MASETVRAVLNHVLSALAPRGYPCALMGILLKLLAGRIIDRADAAMLLRENRDVIQFDYLHAWVARLDLTLELSEVWQEAYPDEESPPALPPG